MRENYNGYELSTAWDDGALGFGFSVHDKNGTEVSHSGEGCGRRTSGAGIKAHT